MTLGGLTASPVIPGALHILWCGLQDEFPVRVGHHLSRQACVLFHDIWMLASGKVQARLVSGHQLAGKVKLIG